MEPDVVLLDQSRSGRFRAPDGIGARRRPGTAVSNAELGPKPAGAAHAFLVSQGIAESRIEIATKGASQLLMQGTDEAADAANRRGEFRLLLDIS